MKQSEQLTTFYRAYKQWLDDGAPVINNHGFNRRHGLCGNLSLYFQDSLTLEKEDEIFREMNIQFNIANLAQAYPFCTEDEYWNMSKDLTHHLLQKRVDWVNEHAQ